MTLTFIKRYFTISFLLAVFCTTQFTAAQTHACQYKVYLDISNGITPELLHKETWSYVAQHCDGPWMLTYDLRVDTGFWTMAKKQELGSVFTQKDTYVEIPLKKTWDKNKEFDHIKVTEDCGFHIKGVVWYREPEALLSMAQLDQVNLDFGSKFDEVLILARTWKDEYIPLLEKADGIVFEFALPYRFDFIPKTIPEGVKWALDHHKKAFLLMPPSPDSAYLNNRYINASKDFFYTLKNTIGDERLNSPDLAFIPAAYNWHKKKIHLTPEINADGTTPNTASGFAYWLLQQKTEITSKNSQLENKKND